MIRTLTRVVRQLRPDDQQRVLRLAEALAALSASEMSAAVDPLTLAEPDTLAVVTRAPGPRTLALIVRPELFGLMREIQQLDPKRLEMIAYIATEVSS